MPKLAELDDTSVEQLSPALAKAAPVADQAAAVTLPISVVIAARNEAHNLPTCLQSLHGVGEIYVVDSGSTDDTVEIAQSFGAKVFQFQYQGGWPKKRQWALDSLRFQYEWVLLLDADESLTPDLYTEMQAALQNEEVDGYFISLDMHFLGRRLRHCDASFYKLSLFRVGKGRFECRAQNQDTSMCDMEVHEHVVVNGPTRMLNAGLLHRNVESLSRYIQKHNEYSNWEVRVWNESGKDGAHELVPDFWGRQAQRRRWLRKQLFHIPGSPVLFFFYKYFLRLGFLDGVPGLIYCGFQAVQFFHIKAKLYEHKILAHRLSPAQPGELVSAKD